MTDKSTLARVAHTPRPPYYAVTTTMEFGPGFDREGHFRLGVQLYGRAHTIGGFLGLEVFFDGRASVAISYWDSLESIERWRNDPAHGAAKRIAKSEWFGATITRIARVESDYSFNLEPAGDTSQPGTPGFLGEGGGGYSSGDISV